MDPVPEPSLLAAAAFPDYRVRARNLARDSANTIHDDGVARAYGYAAGLVAGEMAVEVIAATRHDPAATLLAWLLVGGSGSRRSRPKEVVIGWRSSRWRP